MEKTKKRILKVLIIIINCMLIFCSCSSKADTRYKLADANHKNKVLAYFTLPENVKAEKEDKKAAEFTCRSKNLGDNGFLNINFVDKAAKEAAEQGLGQMQRVLSESKNEVIREGTFGDLSGYYYEMDYSYDNEQEDGTCYANSLTGYIALKDNKTLMIMVTAVGDEPVTKETKEQVWQQFQEIAKSIEVN